MAMLGSAIADPAEAQTGPLPPGQIIVGPIARGMSFPSTTPGPPDGRGTTVPQITNGAEADIYLQTQVNGPSTKSFVDSASSPAVAILTTAPVQYVRFYSPGTNQAGAFLVPSYVVRGLTAAQVKDVLALPFMPATQTVVQVPAGSCLIIGTAGPILNALTPPLGVWGNGGAVQIYLVGKNVGGSCGTGVPGFTGTFLNGQPIGNGAFLYGPHLPGGNAGSVAAALDRGPYAIQLSGMDSLYNALDLINTPGDSSVLRSAMLQLDGEVHPSTQSVILGDSLYVRQVLLQRIRQATFADTARREAALAFGGPLVAYAHPSLDEVRSDHGLGQGDLAQTEVAGTDRQVGFWMQGIGAWGWLQGNGDAAGLSRTLAGFMAGADHRFAPKWFAGVAAGYTTSSVGIGERLSNSSISSAHVAAYTGASFGPWQVRSAFAASFNTVSTNRTVSFPGFLDVLSSTYSATTTQLFTEVGYATSFGRFAIEPFASLSFVHLDSGGFSERGTPGVAALSSPGNSDNLGYSVLGARAATHIDLTDSMVLTPHLSVAWQHGYGDVAPTAPLAFTSNGASFTTTAVPLARDAALIEAGLSVRVNRQLALDIGYLGQLSAAVQDTWLTGRLSLRF
jgi:outer membrane autotransporter protein